jgi:aminoglycoside phosphotransferase (APT) family kinase protein
MSSRAGIYYWKCDRAQAFYGTVRGAAERAPERVMELTRELLREALGDPALELRTAGGQGNHLTFTAHSGPDKWFVRVEDGPEGDDYMEVESALLMQLKAAGIPAPGVRWSDATRARAPFALHALECIAAPDLNTHLKQGTLDLPGVLAHIGRWVARWQALPVRSFGPFDIAALRDGRGFVGLHATSENYYFLNFDQHLAFLLERGFLTEVEITEITRVARPHRALLRDSQPVLVHKDLALWNVLGTPNEAIAIIAWDDAVGGDPMDDLSLLACFHPAACVNAALTAYAQERALPDAHMTRFWLHLLRNLLVKSVIRVGAGYFEHSGDRFLLGAGGGAALKAFTLARLRTAVAALREGRAHLEYD